MLDKKTINIVCDYASLYGGNFIPSLINLEKHLVDYNIIFTFPIAAKNRNWTEFLINQGFNLFFIDFSHKFFKKELKKIDNQNNVHIVYSHFISGLRIKTVYPFSKKTKLLIHVHSDFTGGQKVGFINKLKQFIEFHLLRRDAQYIYVSESMWQINSNLKGHNFVRNALCLDRIPGISSSILDNSPQTVFLTFGWSPFVKGLDITVKAFIESKSRNTKLVIVHGRDDGYQKCASYLQDKIGNDSFLNDQRITFVPPTENVFDYYSVSDVFISSSRSEGFSYSILEALYFNLIVLSSDIVGTAWAKQYENVCVFKSENSDELRMLIDKNAGSKKSLGFNKIIKSDFDIDQWSDEISKIMSNL